MTDEEKREAETWAFETFAKAYPHEAAEVEWDKFVAFTRKQVGWEIPEEQIRKILKETEVEA